MKTLRLAPGLSFPLEAATRAFGWVGQRGTGKSNAVVVFVEQLVRAGGRAVVADPTGVWWGVAHPGSGPGLPAIILGGEHGDVPLEETGGNLAAELVHDGDYPLVVLDLKLLRKAAQVRFMADFCESLYHANRRTLELIEGRGEIRASEELFS